MYNSCQQLRKQIFFPLQTARLESLFMSVAQMVQSIHRSLIIPITGSFKPLTVSMSYTNSDGCLLKHPYITIELKIAAWKPSHLDIKTALNSLIETDAFLEACSRKSHSFKPFIGHNKEMFSSLSTVTIYDYCSC